MRKRILITSMVTLLSASMLFGCSSDSKKTSESTTKATKSTTSGSTQSDSKVTNTSAVSDITEESFDAEDYTRVLVADSGTKAEDGVTVMESTEENTITLSKDSVSTKASGVSVEGTTVTISSPGVYLVTGTVEDGQIVVDCEEKGTVEIVLNNADISNSKNAPVYVKNAKKVLVVLAENSENTLSDAAEYTYEDTENEEPSACLFSKDDLVLSGGGSLTVNGNFNNGIASKDTLKITGGVYQIKAAGNGIKGKDCVLVADGEFTIDAGGDGIKSDNDTDTSLGYIHLYDGIYDITSGEDGIQAETQLIVSDGEFKIKTGSGAGETSSFAGRSEGWDFNNRDGNSQSQTDEESASVKGMKAGTVLNVENGTVEIDAEDDAVHSNGTFYMKGGTLVMKSGDDGIHADSALTIDGGTVTVTQSYEGIEGVDIVINGGELDITASDDGMNGAGGEVSSSQGGGMGGMMSSSSGTLTITGGKIHVDAGGDGLDANGALTIDGGDILVEGPTNDGNAPIDFDNEFTINGGTVIATGSSGMLEGVSNSSKQNNVTYVFDNALSAGTLLQITDESGDVLMETEINKTAASLIFSSEDLKTNKTYTVKASGEEIGTFTVSSVVTTVGSAGGMGGMGPGMGGGRNGQMQMPDGSTSNGSMQTPPDMNSTNGSMQMPDGSTANGSMQTPPDMNSTDGSMQTPPDMNSTDGSMQTPPDMNSSDGSMQMPDMNSSKGGNGQKMQRGNGQTKNGNVATNTAT